MSIRARLRIVRVIIFRDLREFSRDRLWMVLTPLSLVVVVGVFMVLPDGFGRSISIGIYPARLAGYLDLPTAAGMEGVRFSVTGYDTISQLEEAVTGDDASLDTGMAFPEDFPSRTGTGDEGRVLLFLSASVPPYLEGALGSGVREIGYAAQALLEGADPMDRLPVRLPRLGSLLLPGQGGYSGVSLRQRIRPLLTVLILLIESLALAGLVSMEIEGRTAAAILVTPAGSGDVLAAKCFLGVLLAAVQAAVFLLATGAFQADWLLLASLILLGSVLASSVGMLTGAGGRDFIGTVFFGLLFLIPLMIPALYTLIPGRPPLPVRLLPSYGLVESFRGVFECGLGWGEVLPWMAATAAWAAAMLMASILVLRKSLETL